MTEKQYRIRAMRYPEDLEAVLLLWQASGPGIHLGFSDTPAEISRKLERDPDLFLVAELEGKLIGTVIGGYDGRRGIVYHLAVNPGMRKLGLGSALMQAVESRLRQKGCYKSYLMVVKDNPEVIDFYRNRGWSTMDVTVMGKELDSDDSCMKEPC